MGAETSKENGDVGIGGASVHEAIDVAAFEAEGLRMREISRMDHQVRSRFARGVRYNMKVVVRGSRKTGKTLLWKRFQGMPFSDKIATINWTSPSSAAEEDEAVKVEVWDVVDQAFRTPENSVNRISTADLVYSFKEEDAAVSEGKHTLKLLDAQTVEVYRGANAALFLINPFDRASLDYVADQCKAVPETVCILLMLNFRDKLATTASAHQQAPEQQQQQQQQQVTLADVQELAAQIGAFRSNLPVDDVTVIQTSLQDGFGLLHLHHYLDVPLLRLKQRTLQQQLARVEADLVARNAHIRDAVRGARYDDYLRHRQARLRDMQDQHGHSATADDQPGEGGAAAEAPPPASATLQSTAPSTATATVPAPSSSAASPRPESQASSAGGVSEDSLGAEGAGSSGSGVLSGAGGEGEGEGECDGDGDSVQVQASSAGGTEGIGQLLLGAGGSLGVAGRATNAGLEGEEDEVAGEGQCEEETLSPFCVSPSTSSTVALSSTSVSAAATPRQPGAAASSAVAGASSSHPASGREAVNGARTGRGPGEVLGRTRTGAALHTHSGDGSGGPSSSSDSDSDEDSEGAHGMAQKVGFGARVTGVGRMGGRRPQRQQQQTGARSGGSAAPPAEAATAPAIVAADAEEADL